MEDEKEIHAAEIAARGKKVVAEAESERDAYLAAAAAREERKIQLLEQITLQLESIEQSLRDRVQKK
jgi:uncharacterized protein YbaP (TraB family)